MFVVVTRNFPPDVGGIQILMEGLCNSLLSHGPVKVFADQFESSEDYDKTPNLVSKEYQVLKFLENIVRQIW